jgi:hypothetical protein
MDNCLQTAEVYRYVVAAPFCKGEGYERHMA